MPGQTPTDVEIIECIKRGYNKDFHLLVERHLPSLIGFFRYVGVPRDLIDDLIQETFLRAYEKIHLYDTGKSFTTWLTVIGKNLFISEMRKKNRKIPDGEARQVQTESEEAGIVVRHTARELLTTLDETSRFLVELRIFRDLPFAEISEITGEPLATLRVRFHRILNRLRVEAEREGAL